MKAKYLLGVGALLGVAMSPISTNAEEWSKHGGIGVAIVILAFARLLELASALSGATGTAFLYFGTFGFKAPAVWTDDKFLRDMSARNRRRLLLQRIGLALPMVSLLLAFAHVFVE